MSDPLRDALRFAQAHESPWPRDPHALLAPGARAWGVHHDDPPPFNRLRGPVHARGPQTGVVLRHGEEIAAWGEPDRADLTRRAGRRAARDHYVWIDPELDSVVVLRWLDPMHAAATFERFAAALRT